MTDKHWTRYLPTDTAEYGKPADAVQLDLQTMAEKLEEIAAEERRLFTLKVAYEQQASEVAGEQYSARDVCKARNRCRNANNKEHGHVVRL